MISLMCFYIERDLDDKGREQFRASLERDLSTPKVTKPRHLKSVDTGENKAVTIKPGRKWQAPPGWTPPGWNEEKSYQSAKQFMAFQSNPK